MSLVYKLLLITLLSITACQRDNDAQVPPVFDVTVQGVGGDCNLPLLDFGTQTNAVDRIVGLPSANKLYYAVNLNPTYQKAGTTLTVRVRKITPAESIICTTMGPAYNSVAIVSAKPN